MSLQFELKSKDGRGRRGAVTVPHGTFQTPAFMPVGTRGTVKGMTPKQLAETGAEICLGNTYHLNLAPGDKLVAKLGGLHSFMAWDKPILTDSGGFQVFSLPRIGLDEKGVTFVFEKSGKPVTLTPEISMKIQQNLGADIVMAFDVCVEFPTTYKAAQEAIYRTDRWLARCKETMTNEHQSLFGIVQGSVYDDLRVVSAQMTIAHDLPGYAIGGVSVGETLDLMMQAVDAAEPHLPEDKPRYLMGVGYPQDIVEAVWRGMDMFDCVLPTRLARSGVVFGRQGRFRVTKGQYRQDKFPIDPQCACYACEHFSRAYIKHLIGVKEILGSVLTTTHNLTFYQNLMSTLRAAIHVGKLDAFRNAFHFDYTTEEQIEALGLPADRDAKDDLPWDTTHSCIPTHPRELSGAM